MNKHSELISEAIAALALIVIPIELLVALRIWVEVCQ